MADLVPMNALSAEHLGRLVATAVLEPRPAGDVLSEAGAADGDRFRVHDALRQRVARNAGFGRLLMKEPAHAA